jgi:hypothetical protein
MDPRFKRAFDALTPGRQRSYLYHFAAAKQSATRTAQRHCGVYRTQNCHRFAVNIGRRVIPFERDPQAGRC